MRNSTVVTVITLMAGIAIGYLLRGWLQPSPTSASTPVAAELEPTTTVPANTLLSRTDVAEVSSTATTGELSLDPDLGDAVTEESASAAMGNGFVSSEAISQFRQQAADAERAGLQDFFELYGITGARADAIVDALVEGRRAIRQQAFSEQRAASTTFIDMTVANEAIDQLERDVFGEYYDGYQEYKPKQYAHQAVSRFSSELDQPLDLTVRTQVSDIVYEARMRQQANSTPPVDNRASATAGPSVEMIQFQHQQTRERHDDILGQTERILTREQQQAFIDHLARQREMSEIGLRLMELRRQQRGR